MANTSPISGGIPLSQPPGIPLQGGPRPPDPTANASPQARHAAQEFESVFLTEMLQPMFEGLNTDGLGGGGQGEEMFRPMLIQQYADAISKGGGIGIAAHVLAELNRMHAATPDQNAADAVAHAPPLVMPPAPTSMAALDEDSGSSNGADR